MSEGERETPEIPADRLLRAVCALVAGAGGLVTITRDDLKRAENLTVWWSQNEDGGESLWIAPAREEGN